MGGYFLPITSNYGKLNERLVRFAFEFLFPDRMQDKEFYKKFLDFVNDRYSKLGCTAIWQNSDSPFSSLVGTKEVIIDSRSVRISRNFKVLPQTALFI